MIHKLISIRSLLWLGCASALLSVQALEAAQPNIVLIVADDLGQRDLGCYGNTFYETPRLDALAASGLRFTDAYSGSPVCSPTRASIVTGKHPAHLQMTDYIPGKHLPHAKITPPASVQHLVLAEETLAELLGSAGYVTAHLGKWHLGGHQHAAEKQGYDLNIGGSHLGLPRTYFAPYKLPNLKEGPQGEYLTDRLSEEAVQFLKAQKDKPFFLSLCYYAVHTPIQGKPEYRKHYREKAAERGVKWNDGFAAMVQSVDEGVGRILDTLEEQNLAENTIVIFISDNGGTDGITNNLPLRAGKGYVYEGGIRVPLIVRWPGHTPAGKTCSTPVCSMDLKATLLEASLGEKAAVSHQEDGLSILPLLKDPEAELARDSLTFYYPHYSPQGGNPAAAIRVGDWKLIEHYETGKRELYNLSKDLGEQHDLAESMSDKTAELTERLHDQLKAYGALYPAKNPNYDPENPLQGAYWGKWVP